MNSFQSLNILLPCHSLEDFPVHHTGDDAKGLLESWMALWHPELISTTGTTLKWHQAEETPADLEQALIVVPSVAQKVVSDTLAEDCQKSNSLLLEDFVDRHSLIAAAMERLDSTPRCTPDIAADFFALGYAYLQVQLMTRQLRYSSNLDEARFEELVVTAANSSDQSLESVQEKLQACFDLLLEEKARYYPVEANLIDLTLIADSTLGKSLKNQLARPFKQNLLITGALCKKMATQHPETLSQIKDGVAETHVDVVGGTQDEFPDPLMSINSIVRNLERAQSTFETNLGVRPTVFARRTTGLFPALPEVLEKSSFHGVLHTTFDEGRIPSGLAANVRWEAPSGDSVLALAQTPVDANAAETFVNFGIRVGESIDSEHQATVLFVHWPGQVSPVFEDLLRVHRYGPLLGNFVTLSEHFESVYDPGYGECHLAPEYRNAYLKQAVACEQIDPISRYTRYWNRTWRIRAVENLILIANVHSTSNGVSFSTALEQLAKRVDNDVLSNSDENLDEELTDLLASVRGALSGSGENLTAINTLNFSRLSSVTTQSACKPSSRAGDVYLRDSSGEHSVWVVNCPPLGHCELLPSEQSKKTKLGPSVVDDGTLQNEFFRLRIDEQTGGLRSLNVYDRRVNLMTQHLAMREFSGHPNLDRPRYSSMVAKKIDFSSQTGLAGKVVTHGHLLIDDQVVTEFQQTISVKRGSRLIDFEVEFDSIRPIKKNGNGWDNYLCSRIAWLEETAKIRRELHSTKYSTNEKRLCSPNFIEIDDLETPLTLITGGMPYHQRSGTRQLDTVLVCPGETERKFTFAVAVNAKYSSQAVADWNTPPVILENTKLSEQSSNWLFHFSSKNIIVVLAKAILDENNSNIGVHFRLQETEGRRGDLVVHCPFPVKQAQLVNLLDVPTEMLKTENNKVITDFLGSQMLDIRIHW